MWNANAPANVCASSVISRGNGVQTFDRATIEDYGVTKTTTDGMLNTRDLG